MPQYSDDSYPPSIYNVKEDLERSYPDLLHLADLSHPNYEKDVALLEDDSPYPEVRAAVANTDDPSIPSSTLRAWIIGLFFTVTIAGLNQFFFFRYPSVAVTGLVPQLLSFPVGRFWALIFPRVKIFGVSINPGPFTIKEHVIITIMASVGAQSAYATDIVAVQRMYYNQSYGFGYQWFMVMSTQLIGLSIGGVAKRFLVQPPSMIWPANLVNTALFNTLHHRQYDGMGKRGGMSRERFFVYVLLGSFFWYFLPGYLFQALSFFNWVCWIAPNNIKVNQMFGYWSGMGMSVITFDWAQVAYIGSPLSWPWWASANVAFGFFFFFWLVTPILHYSNIWYAQWMPMSSSSVYDRFGAEYDVARIVNPDATLNEQMYKEYSPLFMSTTFALSYGLSFAAITATITHTFIYCRKLIWQQARKSMSEQPDIHARLMSRYPQVPEWWFVTIFMTMFVFGILSIEMWPTHFPVWALLLALLIAFVYIIPAGMIQAITNQQIGLNVITELIIGYALPGRPVAMMMFKTWGYITMAQALTFTSDFKLGHYMKIPPRAMFWCQVVATVIAGTVQLGVQSWMFHHIPDICSLDQPDGFICLNTRVFGAASIIWGVVGPSRQFSHGQIYYGLVYFFILGAILPVITWALQKLWPNSFLKYLNWPIVFSGIGFIPPATALNYVPWTVVAFTFNYFIRRRYFSWWAKYNYILSAGLDAGVALSVIFIFFTLQYPKNGTIGAETIQVWWGNTVFLNNVDFKGTPLRPLAEGETFGPSTW